MAPKATFGLLAMLVVAPWPAWSEKPRNLLLISIDTLRADHLSSNGAQNVRTPHMDRLAREGVNFTRARSPVPLTLPAHASIFTGHYPPTHTVRSNGGYRLPESQVTLAELLSERGFRTAAFVGSFVLDRRFGIDQGFDHYDDRVWSEVEEIEQAEAERTAAKVVSAFETWFDRTPRDDPWFVWIHLYDPHAPYEPPEPYRSDYAGDPYAGEVAYTDAAVGRIRQILEAAGELDRTLVALVGDHGEGLGEHGENTHSLLIYNSTLHVPMVLWGPGLVPAGRRIESLVRIIDLTPTILDYLKVPPRTVAGVSLRERIDRAADEAASALPPLSAYSESLYPELALGWSPLRGIELQDSRLIQAPDPELYALASDPGETRDQASVDLERLKGMQHHLAKVLAELEEGTADPVEHPDSLNAETRAQLESLGYVATSAGQSGDTGLGRDPKEGIALWNRIQLGIAQMGRGAHREAAATFEEVLAEDPDIPLVYESLATCWREQSQNWKAASVLRAGLERGIDSAHIHRDLGQILLELGERDGAEGHLQRALELDPQSVVAHYELGNLYRGVEAFDRAIGHYQAALDLNPNYIWAWNGLAMTLATKGEAEEATTAFRRVVEIAPDDPRGLFNLAVQLERVGRTEEAVSVYERFLESPEDAGLAAQRRQAAAALERLGH